MLQLIEEPLQEGAVLEPACYDAPFLRVLKEKFPHWWERLSVRHAIDIAPPPTAKWINDEGGKLFQEDFLLWEAPVRYSLIVGNPPYGIPGDTSHYPIPVDPAKKRAWKSVLTTWQGKYNLYAAFIEKSVRLLKDEGQLIFVVPGTFLFLDEFGLLRRLLAYSGSTNVYYVGKKPFDRHASVSVIFLHFRRGRPGGIRLFDWQDLEGLPRLLATYPLWSGEPVTFATSFSRTLLSKAFASVGDLFSIHISPRTPEIRRAQAEGWITTTPSPGYLPVLTSTHLGHGMIHRERPSRYFIAHVDVPRLRPFFLQPRIVVSLGFHQGRLAAGYDDPPHPWMGDVYHLLPRKPVTPVSSLFSDISTSSKIHFSWTDVVTWLTSPYVMHWIRDNYRDFIYHINKQQLATIPLLEPEQLHTLQNEQVRLFVPKSLPDELEKTS